MDREVMTLSPDEYDIANEMTDIPYLFDNGNDIYSYGGSGREIGIYAESGYETLGVQLFYNYNGVTTESEIATLDIATGEVTYQSSSVNTIQSGRTVVGRTYYDLTGRHVSHPVSGGVYIQRLQFSDGTTTSIKSIAR